MKWFGLFFICFIPPGIRFVWRVFKGGKKQGARAERLYNPPNAATVLPRILLSSILSLLNPILLLQSLLHIGGQLIGWLRSMARGRVLTVATANSYGFPFEGTWVVAKGGTTPATSHSWNVLNQRYAYDFVITGPNRLSYRTDGRSPSDYYAFGQPVLAPADGIVIAARDGVRDCPWTGRGWIDFLTTDFRGNFVVIQHQREEYSMVGHLMRGTLRVKRGEQVRRGQLLGLCGNSGQSTEPHIHFQIQDHPNFFVSLSVPLRFMGDVVEGGERVTGTRREA